MKVKYKLPLVVVLLSVLPILAVSFVAIYLIDDTAKRDFSMIIKNQSRASVKHVTDFYTEQKNAIHYVSQIDIYKAFVIADMKRDKQVQDSLYPQVKRFQVLSKTNNDAVNQSYILNLSGLVLVCSNDYEEGISMADIPAFSRCVDSKDIAFEIVNKSENKYFFIFAPILDYKEEVLGVLVREVNMDYINRYIKDLKVGTSGYQYILDNNGNTLSHYYSNRLLPENTPNSRLEEFFDLSNNIKDDTLSHPSGFFSYTIEGRQMIAYYEQIPSIKWVVVSAVPYKELTQSTTAMRYALLLSATLVIIVASFAGLKIALFFTSSLGSIIKRVMLIANGHFDVDTPPKTHDEFDILHENITTMAYKLRTSYKKLSDSAKTDALTGLFNRNALYEVMDNNFHNKKSQAAMLIDLDGFKSVNDTLGHDYGDDVLISVANVLRNYESSDVIVSRLGGDEFFVYVINFDNKDEVVNIAKNLLHSICNIKLAMGKPIDISASVGVAFVDDSDHDKSSLIKKADLAMYEIKKNGKSNVLVFDSDKTQKTTCYY